LDAAGRATAGLLRPLREGQFRLLWSGQAISALGDPVFPFAIAFLALDTGRGAAGVGVVFAARATAGALVTLIGGVLADRLPRRYLMIGADLLRAVVITAIVLQPAGSPAAILAALVFLVGVGESLFRPAYSATLPATVPAELLQVANSLTSVTLRTTSLLGPALAGLLVALTGPRVALLVDAATFLASIGTLTLMRDPAPRGPSVRRSLWSSALEGLDAVRRRRWIALMVVAAFAQVALAVAPWVVLLPVVSQQRLGGSPSYATILVAFGLGGVGGAVAAGRVKTDAPGTVACLCLTPFALALAALAAGLPLPLVAAVHLLAGAGLEVYNVLWATALQRDVPNELLGRVFAIDQVGTLALTPLAYAATAPAAQAFGAAPVLLAGAVATLASTWLPLLDPGVRRFSSLEAG